MKIIIAYNKTRYKHIARNIAEKFPNITIHEIENQDQLTESYLKEINPDYIFFPHWSYIIKEEIYENYNCVMFHMTDLPFGRGGSPLQNLIARGIYETKLSAFKCVKELDAGPIYFKKGLSLYGSAEEIFLRASVKIEEMIECIIQNHPIPVAQSGEVIEFERRKPYEGDLSKLESLIEVYDYIRMLDAEDYPRAFIEIGDFRFEFERASLKKGEILADVRIQLKEGK